MVVIVFKKVKRTRFDPNKEAVNAAIRIPGKIHIPAMQVPAKAKRRVDQRFSNKVVTNAANIKIPIFT